MCVYLHIICHMSFTQVTYALAISVNARWVAMVIVW